MDPRQSPVLLQPGLWLMQRMHFAGKLTLLGAVVVGLLVDAVYEVFDAPPGDFEPVPQLGTRIDASYLRGMSRVRGEVIGVLALERVLAQHELGALIASHMPH